MKRKSKLPAISSIALVLEFDISHEGTSVLSFSPYTSAGRSGGVRFSPTAATRQLSNRSSHAVTAFASSDLSVTCALTSLSSLSFSLSLSLSLSLSPSLPISFSHVYYVSSLFYLTVCLATLSPISSQLSYPLRCQSSLYASIIFVFQ